MCFICWFIFETRSGGSLSDIKVSPSVCLCLILCACLSALFALCYNGYSVAFSVYLSPSSSVVSAVSPSPCLPTDTFDIQLPQERPTDVLVIIFIVLAGGGVLVDVVGEDEEKDKSNKKEKKKKKDEDERRKKTKNPGASRSRIALWLAQEGAHSCSSDLYKPHPPCANHPGCSVLPLRLPVNGLTTATPPTILVSKNRARRRRYECDKAPKVSSGQIKPSWTLVCS